MLDYDKDPKQSIWRICSQGLFFHNKHKQGYSIQISNKYFVKLGHF